MTKHFKSLAQTIGKVDRSLTLFLEVEGRWPCQPVRDGEAG